MSVSRLHLGLPRSTPSEEPNEVLSIAEMRRAIVCGARHSRVIRECLEAAERHDFAEEEFYVWLAYQALVRLEELDQACTCSKAARVTEFPTSLDVDGHF